MATVSATWNTTNGDWFGAGNWLEPNPNPPPQYLSYVPGAGNDVSVPGGSAAPFTISYDGTDTVDTLSSSAAVTLSMSGGSLEVLNSGFFDAMDVGAAALLTLDAEQSYSGGSFTGTVSGAGTLRFINGQFAINAGAVLNVANWLLDYQVGSATFSDTTLNTNFSYGGNFELLSPYGDPSFLSLNGYTLTSSGTAVLSSVVDGLGTLLLTGTTTIGGATFGDDPTAGFAAADAATVQNTGAVSQDGFAELNGTIVNEAAGSWTFTSASSVVTEGSGGTFTNDGTLGDTATNGNSEIQGAFNNNGAITIAAGATLVLDAGTEAVDGTVSGAGTLAFGFAHNATLAPASITVGTIAINGGNGGGTLSLGENLAYGGDFDYGDQFGYVSLAGYTLTLSGTSSFAGSGVYGPGRVVVSGTSTIGYVTFGNSASTGTAAANAITFENAGSVTQDGYVGLNGTILNDAGATYGFSAPNTISNDGATFTNDGTLSNTTSGTAEIQGAFTNSGTISIAAGATILLDSGKETVDGTVSGAGTLDFGFGQNATLAPASITVGEIYVNGGNYGGSLALGETLAYGGVFDDVNTFGTFLLAGYTATLSGTTTFEGGGIDGPGIVKVTATTAIGGNILLGYDPASGFSASAAVTLDNAGSVTQDGNVSLNGTIQNDAGATWTITGGNIAPDGSSPSFTNGGTLSDTAPGTTYIGGSVTNDGTLTVASGSTLVLQDGTETLDATVSGGGTLNLGGSAVLAPSSLTVSALNVVGTTRLGESLGYAGTFSNRATLELAGDTLTLTGPATFEGGVVDGPGRVVVKDTATIGSNILLGYDPMSAFAPTAASTVENAGSVTQDGNVDVNGTILNDAGAAWTITGGNIAAEGPGGTFTNIGALRATTSGTVEIDTALVNSSTVTADAGTLRVRGGVTNDGTFATGGGILQLLAAITAGAGQSGSITVAGSDLLELGNTVAASQTVAFHSTSGTLQLDDASGFAGTVAGFQTGDLIDITNDGSYASGDRANLLAGNVLQVTAGNQTVIADLQLDPAANYSGEFFHLGADSATGGIDVTVNTVACYCGGTLILTDRGDVPVESLAIGDTVVTVFGAARPIKWVGWRSYTGRFLAGRRDMLPICFKAGSLSPGLPRRDLLVSPKHAMYLDGVLIPAGQLVNGRSVVQLERADRVTYYHVELDSHDLLLAEGAAAESFVDDGSRGMFHNAFEYARLYPGQEGAPALYCAPRFEDGYEVEQARRRILGRWAAQWAREAALQPATRSTSAPHAASFRSSAS